MIEVKVRDNTVEALDQACKIFKKKVNDDGILRDIMERKYYETPSQKRRREAIQREREQRRE